ncbi:hypothetical protein SAMN05444166_5455 [Singulisphaera sp. GP187]|uniref:hypothetical protein n=1 Tax=Singulisphaera sp. GP187 TaxID=1882752 RepID=UPI000927B20A|nr:hypothetical protein [Singulisphaera sp. GP187]SIO57654.1 hypothetical protein SAMN05444166_5455 [Singulisphaera sp. GP187]
MHPPRLTVGQILLVIAACSIGLASLNGNHLWFMGLSMLTIIGLLGMAVGAAPDAGRPRASSPR